jgi:hypothetical protein
MKRLGVPPWTDAALHRSYIGEQTSLLYYPLALRDGKIVDALQGRTYGAAAGWEALIARATPPGIGVGFYAATCPNCGRDLDGDHDTLFLTCGTCDRAWKRAAERLEETTFSAVSGNAREEKFGLPFWRIRVGVEGLSLDSFGEFVRFCNLTRAVPPAMKEKPFYFWVPAFKVNAELFLTLIRRMTLHQWQGEMEQRLGDLACHPATLSAEEGVESLKTAMADLAADKKTFLPKLGTIGIVLKEALLVYFPFRASGGELVRPDIPLGIQKKALQYGLNI